MSQFSVMYSNNLEKDSLNFGLEKIIIQNNE